MKKQVALIGISGFGGTHLNHLLALEKMVCWILPLSLSAHGNCKLISSPCSMDTTPGYISMPMNFSPPKQAKSIWSACPPVSILMNHLSSKH